MEFIDGEPLSSMEDPGTCADIAKALAHFAQIRSDQLAKILLMKACTPFG